MGGWGGRVKWGQAVVGCWERETGRYLVCGKVDVLVRGAKLSKAGGNCNGGNGGKEGLVLEWYREMQQERTRLSLLYKDVVVSEAERNDGRRGLRRDGGKGLREEGGKGVRVC